MRHRGRYNQTLTAARKALSNWLREWEIYRALAGVRDGGPAEFRTVGRVHGGEIDSRMASREGASDGPVLGVGQIRLLRRPAGTTPAWADYGGRPVYVALLKESVAGKWLVAPFSRFSTPAVSGEWSTGIRAVPLRVLCLWNGRVVDAGVVESAWYSGKMAAAKVADALDVRRHTRGGVSLKRVSATRIGPPLLHPCDPRHEYMEEERTIMDQHLGFPLTGQTSGRQLVYEIPPSEYRKAAEERGRYGKEGRD